MTKLKESVEGIILILSCQKYKFTRLREFALKKESYCNWKVIYVIADMFIDSEYILEGNLMTIKCEDSYIHLLKKLVLSLKFLYELYQIQQGVLRSGDDLVFNEDNLVEFLESKKHDFFGQSGADISLITPTLNDLKKTRNDPFMVEYYKSHPEDLENPLHNLKGVDISKYIKRPEIRVGVRGTLYYISNKCCSILVHHMATINYNVFHYDTFSNSYPYTIEDCAVSFILYFNSIPFIHGDITGEHLYEYNYKVAIHTNKYK
jgi:hypothetical protein